MKDRVQKMSMTKMRRWIYQLEAAHANRGMVIKALQTENRTLRSQMVLMQKIVELMNSLEEAAAILGEADYD